MRPDKREGQMQMIAVLLLLILPSIASAFDIRYQSSITVNNKTIIYDVPGKVQTFYESSPQAIETMMKLSNVQAHDVVYDLGSGRGAILNGALEHGAKAIGIEIDPVLVYLSTKRSKAQTIQGDFFKADLSEATVVTLFLGDDVNLMLKPKLKALRPGTRIVSNSHDMGNWKPDRVMQIPGCNDFQGAEREIEKKYCRVLLWVVK